MPPQAPTPGALYSTTGDVQGAIGGFGESVGGDDGGGGDGDEGGDGGGEGDGGGGDGTGDGDGGDGGGGDGGGGDGASCACETRAGSVTAVTVVPMALPSASGSEAMEAATCAAGSACVPTCIVTESGTSTRKV